MKQTNADEQALKDFLLDIDCLNSLNKWLNKVNLFDVLRITRTEIRHSNMLAWLLNPNENHGLDDEVLRGLVQHIVSSGQMESTLNLFEVLLLDFYDFSILREWNHIDLTAISERQQFIICIENKIDSSEHDNQLTRYRNIVEKTYPNFKKMFIYLTPDSDDLVDEENWCSMGYADILTILENVCGKKELRSDSKQLIEDYMEIVRRDILKDEELARICAEIYAKHRRALDLIYENRPDKSMEVSKICAAWAEAKSKEGNIVMVPDKCSKIFTRFTTNNMSSLIPESEEPDSGWGTKNHYFYEIVTRDNGMYLQFVLSSAHMTPEQLRISEIMNAHFPAKNQKENWQWRIHFKTKRIKFDPDEDIDEEKLISQLNRKYEELLAFEQKAKKLLDKKI